MRKLDRFSKAVGRRKPANFIKPENSQRSSILTPMFQLILTLTTGIPSLFLGWQNTQISRTQTQITQAKSDFDIRKAESEFWDQITIIEKKSLADIPPIMEARRDAFAKMRGVIAALGNGNDAAVRTSAYEAAEEKFMKSHEKITALTRQLRADYTGMILKYRASAIAIKIKEWQKLEKSTDTLEKWSSFVTAPSDLAAGVIEKMRSDLEFQNRLLNIPNPSASELLETLKAYERGYDRLNGVADLMAKVPFPGQDANFDFRGSPLAFVISELKRANFPPESQPKVSH